MPTQTAARDLGMRRIELVLHVALVGTLAATSITVTTARLVLAGGATGGCAAPGTLGCITSQE